MTNKDTPEYGSVQTTQVSGNIKTEITKHYQKHQLVLDSRRIEERCRVSSVAIALEKMYEQAERATANGGMIDPAWRFEGKSVFTQRGYFDVIFAYTTIVSKK